MSHLLDLDTVARELIVPRCVPVDVVHTVNEFNLKQTVYECGANGGDVVLQVWTHQVVEGGALLLAPHVFEEAMISHQQQRTSVFQVIMDLTPPSQH